MLEKRERTTMVRLLLAARGLRAFADGYVAVLLPAYLLAIGHDQLAVGILGTATLLGSAAATLVWAGGLAAFLGIASPEPLHVFKRHANG